MIGEMTPAERDTFEREYPVENFPWFYHRDSRALLGWDKPGPCLGSREFKALREFAHVHLWLKVERAIKDLMPYEP